MTWRDQKQAAIEGASVEANARLSLGCRAPCCALLAASKLKAFCQEARLRSLNALHEYFCFLGGGGLSTVAVPETFLTRMDNFHLTNVSYLSLSFAK